MRTAAKRPLAGHVGLLSVRSGHPTMTCDICKRGAPSVVCAHDAAVNKYVELCLRCVDRMTRLAKRERRELAARRIAWREIHPDEQDCWERVAAAACDADSSGGADG